MINIKDLDSLVDMFNNTDAPKGVSAEDFLLLANAGYNCLSNKNNVFQKDNIIIMIVDANLPKEDIVKLSLQEKELAQFKYIMKLLNIDKGLDSQFIGIENSDNLIETIKFRTNEMIAKQLESDLKLLDYFEVIDFDKILNKIGFYIVDNNNQLSENIKIQLLDLYTQIKNPDTN